MLPGVMAVLRVLVSGHVLLRFMERIQEISVTQFPDLHADSVGA